MSFVPISLSCNILLRSLQSRVFPTYSFFRSFDSLFFPASVTAIRCRLSALIFKSGSWFSFFVCVLLVHHRECRLWLTFFSLLLRDFWFWMVGTMFCFPFICLSHIVIVFYPSTLPAAQLPPHVTCIVCCFCSWLIQWGVLLYGANAEPGADLIFLPMGTLVKEDAFYPSSVFLQAFPFSHTNPKGFLLTSIFRSIYLYRFPSLNFASMLLFLFLCSSSSVPFFSWLNWDLLRLMCHFNFLWRLAAFGQGPRFPTSHNTWLVEFHVAIRVLLEIWPYFP